MPLLTTGSDLQQKLATEFQKDITFDDENGTARERANTSAKRYADAIINWLTPFGIPSAAVLDIQDVANSSFVGFIPVPPTFVAGSNTTLPFAFTLSSKNSLNTAEKQGSAVFGSAVKNSESALKAAFFTEFQKDLPNNEVKPTALPRLNSSAGRLAKGILNWVKDDEINKISIEYVVTGAGQAQPPTGNPTISQAVGTTASSSIGFINKSAAKNSLKNSIFDEMTKDLVNDETRPAAETNARRTADRIATGVTNWIDQNGKSSINSITQYQDSLGVTFATGGIIAISHLRVKGNLANLL